MPDLTRLRDDLRAFAEACGFPMAEWQADALVLDKRTTVLISPRQCGKSTSLALLALHRAFARPEQLVLVVSASDEAAKRLLGLAAATATRSRLLSGSVVDESASKIALSNGSTILSVPASERAIRGLTVDLLLVDEAARVDDELLLGAALPTTAARPDSRVVLASSPGASAGAFHAFATGDADAVEVFRWHREDATWITPEVVDAARESLPAALFAREFDGFFADGADDRLIERLWIDEAIARTLTPSHPPVLGVDVARHGGDETVCMEARGGVLRTLWAHRGADLAATAARLEGTLAEFDAPEVPVWIDATGIGWGLIDLLASRGHEDVVPYTAGERAPRPERFANLRASTHFELREGLRQGVIDLDPTDRALHEQLASLTYGIDRAGRILLASKATMSSSPDRADAAVIAFYAAGQAIEASAIADYARRSALDAALTRESSGEEWAADFYDGGTEAWLTPPRERIVDSDLPTFPGA